MNLVTTVTLKHCTTLHLRTILLTVHCTCTECVLMLNVPESHFLAVVGIAFDLFLTPKSYETTRPTSEYIKMIPCIANKMQICPSPRHEGTQGAYCYRPTHSQRRNYMEPSGQLEALASSSPGNKPGTQSVEC